MEEIYQWLKVIHIASFVSWMAMLFYIPRLFVYHAQYRHNEGFCSVVTIQESKLYYCIGYPAMIATFLSGGALIYQMGGAEFLRHAPWLHIKMFLALLLLAYHFLCGYFMKQFAKGTCTKSHKFFRFFNEIPTLILIGIVYLVIFQPSFGG
ncbi:TIGR00701 family protein [Helicobacter enhydrae]|uniref:Protoporphyrinogen IX oxidase n=1 Tax=Helicobacter enhydrae TaxID=222136 RepID=A0A1B1U6U5_9HELI|nr:protoporphyrinogen oxidase HemJ [Helicobacter enhydrae]ANV98513.1 TIGR00701 family protein [Helicobacter enhydrae]